MPFDCALDGPRVVLKPSESREYAIHAGREERRITTCTASGSTECRTIVAHRFQISCGGKRVSWMRVVAAASANYHRDVWIDAGRLHLALERRGHPGNCRAGGARIAARHSGSDDASPSRFGHPAGECLPWDRRGISRIVLPPGFAPLSDIGARIVLGNALTVEAAKSSDPQPLPSAVAYPVPSPAPSATAVSPGMAASIEPAARSASPPQSLKVAQAEAAASPPATTIPVVLTATDASRSWVTQVRPEPAVVDPFMARSPSTTVWLMALMLAAMLAMFARALWTWGTLRPQRFSAVDERAGPDSQSASDGRGANGTGRAGTSASSKPGASAGFGHDVREALRKATAGFTGDPAPRPVETTTLANAAASVSALIEQANGSLGLLSGAPPLREVLEQEIGLIQQRLAIVKAQASDSPEAAHKAAPAFRSLVRDLERVRRISESAAISFSAGHNTVRLPHTKSEAYEVLGVNADIGEATLKKLVDALRVCWHPDLAKDPSDLALREERIKVINVAWELIKGRRAAS